jgi:RNA polymerase sigma-70 factor (ECF subfamily)
MDQLPSASDGPPLSTSTQLLARVREHDPAAWERLVRVYGPLIYAWARRQRLSADDAADVVQEVFRSVAAKIGDFRGDRPGDTFRGWLWTITRNKIHDHFRRQAASPPGAGGTTAHVEIQELPAAVPEDGRAEDGVAQRALAAIRGDFDERTWEAFQRMALDGHSAAEAAAALGMNEKAVRQAKYRVLKRLREELTGLWEE